MFTARELDTLILALAHGKAEFTEDEATRLIRWAERTRADNAMLSLILDGWAPVTAIGDSGPILGKPSKHQQGMGRPIALRTPGA